MAAALGWYLTSSVATAIVLAVAVDQAAGSVTIDKAYRIGREPLRAWLLCGLAGFAGLLAVGQGAAILYLYPASEIVMTACVIGAQLIGAARSPRTGYSGASALGADVLVAVPPGLAPAGLVLHHEKHPVRLAGNGHD